MTAIDLLADPQLLDHAKQELKARLEAERAS
jgi:hypothetical protein